MAKEKKKVSQSEIDGVQYRKAKLWQIILYAFNGLVGMSIYSLIGMASYSAGIGYGIATVTVGVILTGTRILDAITDSLFAIVYDRINTRFGKLRILMGIGWAIEIFALYGMFSLFSSKGHGVVVFTLLYVLYVLGYTVINMTGNTIPNLLTNDPKQRPTVGVWTTVFNYFVPMTLSILFNVVLLPKFGGTYNQGFLTACVTVVAIVSFIGLMLVFIGITPIDKPENFMHLGDQKDKQLKLKDIAVVLKDNKPLQAYVAAAASDKIAQQTASQAIVVTMLNGIIIGNMGLSTILSMIAMAPSIVFAIFGARYAGKHGNKESILTWSKLCIVAAIVTVVFLTVIDTRQIATMGPIMIIYVLLYLVLNGFKMCITTANNGFISDVIDYELDRSGKFVPAVITGTYSLIDKLVSSVSSTIAAIAVAMIGYTTVMPQPGDPLTAQLFWVTMFLLHGLAIIGWVCSIFAMKSCKLDKQEMVEVQKRIADKKAIERHRVIEEELK